ncbi:EF-P lysine aminoacylase EpmA [Marinomonas aquiplantarum]|uniref:Lysyl-tRNA synthetase class 2 n=1 Tax=Marinomonas aquiplantarum TaxID=491951 RepID=A0A366D478_9GAMM|nr:EF-P lysine aminoacylase EpmA [Marinomonas aquiplantarum]RBO84755.1 lysyl-tRNA synthetase class 2 [Marinomonas aquiplantarum]
MYDAASWQPSAELSVLRQRADLFGKIRQFFAEQEVMEVDTQCLSLASISDPHIEVLTAHTRSMGQDLTYYLQTSPEYAMKRLLCAGAGSIYQLGKVFRAEEMGRRHSIEFTMLEWYRVDLDHWQLMAEIEALLQAVIEPSLQCEYLSYQQAFIDFTGLDPWQVSLEALQACAHQATEYGLQEEDRDTLLELIFASVIEPKIGQRQPCFIHSYPASQAALAKLQQDSAGNLVAARFELYWQGMELANGYYELTDAQEQAARFAQDKAQRQVSESVERQFDERLISALIQGMPDCAGVALGVDRLLMLICGKKDIAEVLAFAHERA